MSQLSSKARRVVELSRSADDPVVADQRRIRLALGRRLGAGATATIVGVGTAKVAAGATAAASFGKAIALVSAGVVLAVALGQPRRANHEDASRKAPAPLHDAVGNAAAVSPTERDVAPPQSAALLNPAEREIADTLSPSAGAAIAGPAMDSRARAAQSSGNSAGTSHTGQSAIARFDSLSESDVAASDRSGRTRPAASAASVTGQAAAGTPPAVVDPLQAETAALREVQRAMRSGDPARALALVNAQDVTFASGALGQERAAARIYALCALGSLAQARSEAQQFARRWPRSPMLGRVRAACRAP